MKVEDLKLAIEEMCDKDSKWPYLGPLIASYGQYWLMHNANEDKIEANTQNTTMTLQNINIVEAAKNMMDAYAALGDDEESAQKFTDRAAHLEDQLDLMNNLAESLITGADPDHAELAAERALELLAEKFPHYADEFEAIKTDLANLSYQEVEQRVNDILKREDED